MVILGEMRVARLFDEEAQHYPHRLQNMKRFKGHVSSGTCLAAQEESQNLPALDPLRTQGGHSLL